MMATATRGAEESDGDEPRPAEEAVKEAPAKDELPFDFFIFPNIPCPSRNGYFGYSRKID
jgi:hypothetical protein